MKQDKPHKSLSANDSQNLFGHLKRAVRSNISSIEILITENCRAIFGDVSLNYIIDSSYLPLCQFDVSGKVMGFIALDTFPNNPAAVQNDWVPWIKTMFAQHKVNARNTLFVHMICWDERFSGTFLRHILESLFFSDPFLNFVIFVMPPNSPTSIHEHGTILNTLLLRVIPDEFHKNTSPFLNVAIRSRFCPKLKVRKAVEEDNDDLVALIGKTSSRFQELYGDFYISEIIGDKKKSEHVVLVAEYNNISVGMMMLNTEINYQKLNESFELEVYAGLFKKRKKIDAIEIVQNCNVSSGMSSEIDAVEEIETVVSYNNLNGKNSEGDGLFHDFFNDEKNAKDISKLSSQKLNSISKTGENLPEANRSTDIKSSIDKMKEASDLSTGFKEISVSKVSDTAAPLLKSYLKDDRETEEHLLVDSFNQQISDVKGNEDSLSAIDKDSPKEILSETESYFGDSFYHHMLSDGGNATIESTEFNKDIELSEEKNAFMIEVYTMHQDIDERFGFDLLEVSFEIFPELEYCILSLPSHIKPFPLLEHFSFVSPRPDSSFDHCLYVVHRSSIKGDLCVRHAYLSDTDMIEDLVENLPNHMNIMIQLKQRVLLESADHYAYVMQTDDIVIGVALLKHSKIGSGDIRKHYCMYQDTPFLKPVTPCSAGLVEEMILPPQFQQHSRFFLRELVRISQFGEVFWPMYTRSRIKSCRSSVISTLSHFAPLLRRREIETDSDLLTRYEFNTDAIDEKAPDAMFCINKVICSFPMIDINKKLVLVGASDTAFSFLKSLLFGFFDHRVLECFVSVVANTMKAIDRKNKFILTESGDRLQYDFLFLFCGKQYQSPDYHKEIGVSNFRRYSADCIPIDTLSLMPPVENTTLTDGLQNIFMINSLNEAYTSLEKLKILIGNKLDYNVIVYGAEIEVYCCINALHEYGIPSARIVFVEPSPDCNKKEHQCTTFNNEYVDQKVTQNMMDKQMRIYQRFNYKSHTIDANRKKHIISSVMFESYFQVIDIECVAMFYYGTKNIHKNTFIAINKCGLVYNGGIVIDAEYTTSDRCIYAAGPMTQNSKEYRSKRHNVFKYSSEEVGFKFGEKILNDLNPFAIKKEGVDSTKSDVTINDPKDADSSKLFAYSDFSVFSFDNSERNTHKSGQTEYHDPSVHPYSPKMSVIKSCTLPFGLNYLCVSSPGVVEPFVLKWLRHDYGRVMETFTNGYFRLHLDQEDFVCSITCLTENIIDVNNTKCLWKKHEQLLNKLVYRFEHGQILDFYQYFRQPWAYAIYHDRFDELMEEIDKIYHSKYVSIDECLELCDHENIESFKKSVEEEMIKFLNNNNDMLPMYMNSTHSKIKENNIIY